MAIHTFGTALTTSLNAIQWWPALTTNSSTPAHTLSLADAQAMDVSILSTVLIGPFLNEVGQRGTTLTCGLTTASPTIGTLTYVGGPPLAAIQPGAVVMGIGIPLNTWVVSKTPATGTPTSLTLNQAVTTAAGARLLIANSMTEVSAGWGLDPATGRVRLPDNRGYIQLNPGDVVAIDNTGAVIVVPANSVSYPGSQWVFT